LFVSTDVYVSSVACLRFNKAQTSAKKSRLSLYTTLAVCVAAACEKLGTTNGHYRRSRDNSANGSDFIERYKVKTHIRTS